MSQFQLSPQVQDMKVFFVHSSDLDGRLDPIYYYSVNNLEIVNKTTYPVKKLSEVIEMTRGRFGHRPRNDPRFYGGEYPFIQTGDIVRASNSNGKITYSQTLNELGLKTSRLFDKPVVVITIAANIGDTAILDYPACFPDSLIGMQPKNDSLTLGYINLYFKFIRQYLNDLAPQSAQKNINYQQLAPIPIVVPPLDVQSGAVCIYDAALAQQAQKKQQAAALLASIDEYLLGELGITLPEQDNSLEKRVFRVSSRELSGGRFDPIAFSAAHASLFKAKYSYSQLKEKAYYFKSGFGAGRQDQTNSENGVFQLRPTNINRDGELIFDKKVFVSVSEAANFQLKHEDVLFNNTNSQELVGKTALLLNPVNQFTYSNHITVIRTYNDLNPQYLQNVLNLYQACKYFYSICTNWNNQSGVGVELLKSVRVPIPPLEKQNEIVTHIQSIRIEAAQLQAEATQVLADAKAQIERIILGDS